MTTGQSRHRNDRPSSFDVQLIHNGSSSYVLRPRSNKEDDDDDDNSDNDYDDDDDNDEHSNTTQFLIERNQMCGDCTGQF